MQTECSATLFEFEPGDGKLAPIEDAPGSYVKARSAD